MFITSTARPSRSMVPAGLSTCHSRGSGSGSGPGSISGPYLLANYFLVPGISFQFTAQLAGKKLSQILVQPQSCPVPQSSPKICVFLRKAPPKLSRRAVAGLEALYDVKKRPIQVKGSVPVARWAWHLSGMGMKALEQRRQISKAMRLTVQGSSETLKVWRRGVGNRDTQP